MNRLSRRIEKLEDAVGRGSLGVVVSADANLSDADRDAAIDAALQEAGLSVGDQDLKVIVFRFGSGTVPAKIENTFPL